MSGITSVLRASENNPAETIAINVARINSPTTVIVSFNNPGSNLVSVDATKWHIDHNGGGVSPLTATNAVITSAGTPWSITLTFSPTSTWLSDKTFSASFGLYVDSGGVTSALGKVNNIRSHAQSVAIEDLQPPTVSSAQITGPNSITVVFSEIITSYFGDYTSLVLAAGGARTVTDATDNLTNTTVLTFDGAPATVDETATLDLGIDGTLVDLSSNFNAIVPVYGQAVAAGQRPTLVSARVTSGNAATLVFSEPVTTALGDFSNFVLAAGGARNVTGISGSGGTTIALTFDGDPAATGDTATLDIAGTVLDTSPQLNSLLPLTGQATGDGQRPTVVSASLTGPNTVTVVYSEPVTSSYGDYTNLVLAAGGARNVVSASGSGGATISLTFSDPPASIDDTATLNVAATVLDTSPSANALVAVAGVAATDGQERATAAASSGSSSPTPSPEPVDPPVEPEVSIATTTPAEPPAPPSAPEPALQPVSAGSAPTALPTTTLASTSAPAVYRRYLLYGSRGTEVRFLQTLLKRLGFFHFPRVTGFFGPYTRAAVREFQAAHGIEPVGHVGPKTRAALNALP